MQVSRNDPKSGSGIFKLLAVLLFIPFSLFLVWSGLYSISKSMYPLSKYLIGGISLYVFMEVFFVKMEPIFKANRAVIETIFSFSAALKNISYAVSLVIVAIPFAFRLLTFIPQDLALKTQFFLMGFFFALHTINACSALREHMSGVTLDYLLGFSLIFIFSFTVFVAFLGFIKDVDVPQLYKHSFQLWKDFNIDIFRKLAGTV